MSITLAPHHHPVQTPPDLLDSDRLFDTRRRERVVARARLWPTGPARHLRGNCGVEESQSFGQMAPAPQPVPPASPAPTFEEAILCHLGAANKLARLLTRDAATAEDVVQDACVRAWRYFKTFNGENGRAWLLRIVRNVAYTRLERRRTSIEIELPGNYEDDEPGIDVADPGLSPEATLLAEEELALLKAAVAALPISLRRCMEMRVREDRSYKEIAEIAGIPLGTVMSRLFRARRQLMAAAAAVKPAHKPGAA